MPAMLKFWILGLLFSAAKAREEFQSCFTRQLQAKDVLSVRGRLLPNCTRWTCEILVQDSPARLIHADHRVSKQESIYNSHSAGNGAFRFDLEVKQNVNPYEPGDKFEMALTIRAPNNVDVTYPLSKTLSSVSFVQKEELARLVLADFDRIRCHGGMEQVSFVGTMLESCGQTAPTEDGFSSKPGSKLPKCPGLKRRPWLLYDTQMNME
ncbi:unnamed protein product, partial [Mesorhabditis spiculigera]